MGPRVSQDNADKTDLSLALGALSALAILIAPIAALGMAPFVAGLLLGQRRRRPP